MTALRILYIAGWGRSGSTVLDNILGHAPQRMSVGELRYFWRRGLGENRLCGDGVPFMDHTFWRAVMDRAFGGPLSALQLQSLLAIESRALSTLQQLPRLALFGRASPVRDGAIYLDHLQRLYGAVAAQAALCGCNELVDSSKNPVYAWWLSQVPGVELHVVHLVRDPRAVAWSWQRRRAQPDKSGDMDRHGRLRSMLQWRLANTAAEQLQHCAASYRRLRYEALMQAPRACIAQLEDSLGSTGSDAAFVADDQVRLDAGIAFSGNPSRFRAGPVRLKLDDEWVQAMPPWQKSALAAFAGSTVLKRYGYV